MAIQDCLKTVDYVVIMVHSHEIKADTNEDADFFLEEFARACIDAGACAVLGGGTHQLKGIEIYRGKPIFIRWGILFSKMSMSGCFRRIFARNITFRKITLHHRGLQQEQQAHVE